MVESFKFGKNGLEKSIIEIAFQLETVVFNKSNKRLDVSIVVSPQVMDSVKATALGLHALIADHCPDHNGNRTVLKDCANGPRLLSYIRNLSFEGYSAKTVSFDDKGDLIGGYVIKQVRLADNGEYTHDVIGESSPHNSWCIRWVTLACCLVITQSF